jgi:hypothetical protein
MAPRLLGPTLIVALAALIAWAVLIFGGITSAGVTHLLLAVGIVLLVRWWALRGWEVLRASLSRRAGAVWAAHDRPARAAGLTGPEFRAEAVDGERVELVQTPAVGAPGHGHGSCKNPCVTSAGCGLGRMFMPARR